MLSILSHFSKITGKQQWEKIENCRDTQCTTVREKIMSMQYPCSINVVQHSLKPSLLFLHAPERRSPRLICATASHWDQIMRANWINSIDLIVRQISAEIKRCNWWYYRAPIAPDRGYWVRSGIENKKQQKNADRGCMVGHWLLTRGRRGNHWLESCHGFQIQKLALLQNIFDFLVCNSKILIKWFNTYWSFSKYSLNSP